MTIKRLLIATALVAAVLTCFEFSWHPEEEILMFHTRFEWPIRLGGYIGWGSRVC